MPQFVPKFSTPQITVMMRGVKLNIAPYPEPMRVETIQRRSAWFCINPDAKTTWPIDIRIADPMRNATRDTENLSSRGGSDARELLADW
jgi:hypothetical protein